MGAVIYWVPACAGGIGDNRGEARAAVTTKRNKCPTSASSTARSPPPFVLAILGAPGLPLRRHRRRARLAPPPRLGRGAGRGCFGFGAGGCWGWLYFSDRSVTRLPRKSSAKRLPKTGKLPLKSSGIVTGEGRGPHDRPLARRGPHGKPAGGG